MGTFKIVCTFTTMFSLAYGYEHAFTFSVPSILNSLNNMAIQAVNSAQALTSSRASSDFDANEDFKSDSDFDVDTDSEVAGPTLAEKLKKVPWDILSYMSTMLNNLSRRTPDMKPSVELGPGTFKSEIVTYPPNFFVNRLKMLLRLKKKEEEQNKPLNKPE